MRTRHLAFPIRPAAALAIAVAACSAPAKQVAPTTIVITLPSTVATTSPATTTTTTVAATSSTGPDTTAAPTTTTSAAPTPEQAVRAAWHGWIAAGEACTVDPKGCDRAALAQFMGDTMAKNTNAAADALIARGWRVRKGAGGIEDRYKIEKVTIQGSSSLVQFCEYDAGITDVPATEQGKPDVLISDEDRSSKSTVELTQHGDHVWKVERVVSDTQERGKALWDSCERSA